MTYLSYPMRAAPSAPLFTRRHHVELSALVRTIATQDGQREASIVMDRLATMLQRDNPSFDESVFYAACGF